MKHKVNSVLISFAGRKEQGVGGRICRILCSLDMEVVPPGSVAGRWSTEGEVGAAKPVHDILTQMLKLPGFKAQVILPLLGARC